MRVAENVGGELIMTGAANRDYKHLNMIEAEHALGQDLEELLREQSLQAPEHDWYAAHIYCACRPQPCISMMHTYSKLMLHASSLICDC